MCELLLSLPVDALADTYALPIARCDIKVSGLNDIYFVETGAGPYILKLYRAGWRTRSEILCEVEAILHLARRGIAVSAPVAGRDGDYVRVQPVPAATVTPMDQEYARRIGEAVAAIHSASEDFTCPHQRFSVDLEERRAISLGSDPAMECEREVVGAGAPG